MNVSDSILVLRLSCLLALLFVVAEAQTGDSTCEAADVIFVVDSSGSVNEGPVENWPIVLQFMADIGSNLDIGPGDHQVRIAMVRYSLAVLTDWNLDSGIAQNQQLFIDKTKTLPHMGSWTNTPGGLEEAINIIDNNPGNRANVPNIVLVITDGVTNYRENELEGFAMNLVNRTDTTVVAIGVTDAINRAELQLIASSDQSVFDVADFINLNEIIDQVTEISCVVGPTLASTTTTTIPVCDGVFDLAFIVDSSGSITENNQPNNWGLVLNFIVSFTARLNIGLGANQVRVGVTQFSEFNQLQWDLNDPQTEDYASLREALLGITHIESFSNTPDGLESARTQIFNTDGDRLGVQNVAILIADGQTNLRENDVEIEANLLKTTGDGVRVSSVGITDAIDFNELTIIASAPENVFTVEGFTDLDSILASVLAGACKAPTPTEDTEMRSHCASVPCQNGGHCVEGEETYICYCAQPYMGRYCELMMTPSSKDNRTGCVSKPCINGGQCYANGDDYVCICLNNYEGKHCETKVKSDSDSTGFGMTVGMAVLGAVLLIVSIVVIVLVIRTCRKQNAHIDNETECRADPGYEIPAVSTEVPNGHNSYQELSPYLSLQI